MARNLGNFLSRGLRQLGQSNVRAFSSANDLIVSSPHETLKGVHVVTMRRNPVNSLDLDFLKAIPVKIKELEKDPTCNTFILTSSCPKVFSAGLDIPYLMGKDREFLLGFADALQGLWTSLYGTPLASVAAINGHALAGGCMLTSCCDYRVIVEGATVGLPEVHLGIVAPLYLREMLVNLMGRRAAEWALLTGHALSPDLAQQLGLVDEIKATPEEVTKRSEEMAAVLNKLNPEGRSRTKMAMRRPLLICNEGLKEQNREEFAANGSDPKVQESIKAYYEGLKNRKK